jgi:saccharopine dehydrogenase-like NADP-dependent oxidoreductase
MTIAECGGNCVDVTFMSEDPSKKIPEEAENNGSIIIADFGLAPGITNVLVGLVDKPKNVEILVGGNPIRPKPPLFYNPRFETDTLIEEYIRPARVIRDGKSVVLEPLSEPEMVFFEGVGVQEGFVTDGLRSLLYYDSLENAVEKTLRWPGHRDRIALLKEMGMLSPEIFTGGTDDVVTLKVMVDGRTWTMTCFAEDGLSAMAKTTACPVACAAVRIKDSGLNPWVHAPEDLPHDIIMDIIDNLRQEGIEIKEE